jgi:hypothetical protein
MEHPDHAFDGGADLTGDVMAAVRQRGMLPAS